MLCPIHLNKKKFQEQIILHTLSFKFGIFSLFLEKYVPMQWISLAVYTILFQTKP